MTKLFLLLFATVIFQSTNDFALKNYNLDNGLAIQGYDPVSYFLGEPVKGDKNIYYSYEGVTYRFANQKNKEKFKADPQKYQPQYGGWCAYAMGDDGSKVNIDPETYKITDGKLYLFYNRFFTNTLNYWNEDEEHLRNNADKNWEQQIHK